MLCSIHIWCLLPFVASYRVGVNDDFQNTDRRLADIEERMYKQQHEIEELHAALDKQLVTIEKLTEELIEFRNTTQKNKDKTAVRRIYRSAKSSEGQVDTLVAFSATINVATIQNIGVHQNIVFTDVITNIGNAYNNHQGIFFAPVSGIYMFTTTLLSGPNSEYAAAIVVNGVDIVRLFERGTDNRHGSATQTLIIKLRKGDDISVQSLSPDRTFSGNKYSSISGILLRETEN